MRSIAPLTLIITAAALSIAGGAEPEKLDLNDVSWLWPVPQNTDELARIISMDTLKSNDGQTIWSEQQFEDFVNTATSDAAGVDGMQIDFPDEFKTMKTWRIVAFRADPSAPGGSREMREAFGEKPQLRLILQPVTTSDTGFTVHDVAVHMVFSFMSADGTRPDRDKFAAIISDLDELKSRVESAGVVTTGQPLSVHPGLRANVPGLDAAVRTFLQKHLTSKNLSAMALMGISGPEPWIFLAMGKFPPGAERFGPVPFLPAQMISFRSEAPSVSPVLNVNNRNPISKEFVVPEERRRGVSTSSLFLSPNLSALDNLAVTGTDENGESVTDSNLKNRDIPDLIANPDQAHFFNTDCVSCHTESRRRITLSLSFGPFAYRVGRVVPKVADEVKPKTDWNVRNFGWFTPHAFLGGGPPVATVTQRTANETADVVEFIERNYRSDVYSTKQR